MTTQEYAKILDAIANLYDAATNALRPMDIAEAIALRKQIEDAVKRLAKEEEE